MARREQAVDGPRAHGPARGDLHSGRGHRLRGVRAGRGVLEVSVVLRMASMVLFVQSIMPVVLSILSIVT